MKYLFSLLVFFISAVTFAQLDNPNTRDSGKRIEREDKGVGRESQTELGSDFKIDRSFSTSKKSKTFLGQPDAPTLDPNRDDDKKLNINQGDEYVKRTVDFKPKYLEKEGRGDGEIYKEFSKPQDLGKFTTSGEYVKISWRDAQVVDGDRVDIIVNGEVVVKNTTLLARYQSIKVPLDQGFTKIEFQALNMGESGPNTADFKVEEENGSILTHDEWNLTTGTKASLVVIKN